MAFSPDGIEELNKNIKVLNNGKDHKPIFKVRTYEPQGNKFAVGQKGNKDCKFVEAAKGTNLYFAIYQDENSKRSFDTIPLNIVIERLKQNLVPVPEKDENGNSLLMYLSPNDLVYFPTEDEIENINSINFGNLNKIQLQRLWNVNDFSSAIYFIPNSLASSITPKEVDMNFDTKKNKLTGSYDTKTASFDGKQIKDHCIKLNIDRLGSIIAPNNIKHIAEEQRKRIETLKEKYI